MKFALALGAAFSLLTSPALSCPSLKSERNFRGGPAGSTVMGRGQMVAPPSRHAPVPDGSLDGVRIVLQRTQCFGDCPAYTIEIAGDGAVTYRGGAWVLATGDHISKISPEDVRCLLDGFRAADFWSLSGRYEAPVTDQPTFSLTLLIGGKSKTVDDYRGEEVGMPEAVTGLEDAVDRLSGDERWIAGSAETLPALEAEHFDFRGRPGADLLARATYFAVESARIDPRETEAKKNAARAGTLVRYQIVLDLIARHAPLDGHAFDQVGGQTPAEIAAANGRLDLLRVFAKAGLFETGGPAVASAVLRASVISGRPDMVAEALSHHPDVNGQDANGDTALHLIRAFVHLKVGERQDLAMARLLLKAGADPNIANHDGKTVLHDAFDAEQARAFIAAGAKLETRDADGDTPLLATFNEDVAVVLVQAGANPLAKDRNGQTFITKARGQKWTRALAAVRSRLGDKAVSAWEIERLELAPCTPVAGVALALGVLAVLIARVLPRRKRK